MGSGASKKIGAGLAEGKPGDLEAKFKELPEEEKEKLRKAMAAATADLAKKYPVTVLAKQNSETTQTVIETFKDDPVFKKLAERLCKEIIQRDTEDGEKLAKGIALAVGKGVLPKEVDVPASTKISVSGKSADEVYEEIMTHVGDGPKEGLVMVIHGLSGTGKGTTVAKLCEKLPNSMAWSNGNIFRALTLLAATHAEKEGCELKDALTVEKLADFVKMIEFGKFEGKDKFDVKIEGLDLKYYASEVEKTVLKDSKVAKNIPTVAEVSQGEVVKFASAAIEKVAKEDKLNFIVEGREQTLNHIKASPANLRFELVLDDTSVIGQRQAALQAAGIAWGAVKEKSPSDEDCWVALVAAITKLSG